MKKKKLIQLTNSVIKFFVILFLYFIAIYPVNAFKSDNLKQGLSWKIYSNYFNLFLVEYNFERKYQGHGGAIAVFNDDVLYVSSDGLVSKIDLNNFSERRNYLPSIDLGLSDFKNSKRIKNRELMPRVTDIKYINGNFYIAHDVYEKFDDSIHFAISRFDKEKNIWIKIYKSPPLDVDYYALGSGGKLAFDKKYNRLYFTVADYSLDRINNLPSDIAAQNNNLPWGKVYYINLIDLSLNLVSIGHRNPQGLVFLADGNLLESEHGPRGGDELNLIVHGKNYGWPYTSYGEDYSNFSKYSDRIPNNSNAQNLYEDPVFAFVPSIGATQLIQIFDFDKNWDNDLILASLKAQKIFHVKLQYTDNIYKVMYVEPISVGKRIRDIVLIKEKIILLTDIPSIIVVIKDVNEKFPKN